MSERQNPTVSSLSARRLALLATTILGLSAGAFFFAPDGATSRSAYAQNLTQQAQSVSRPVGFADVVEKVKPAVISVRVKMEASPQASAAPESPFPPGSEMDQYFRRYGRPEGTPNTPPRGRGATSQGSGFFITADGYAVTNNHVVDKAATVEVRTDDGKTYPAKVIGVDQRTDLALIKVEGNNFPFVKFSERAPRIGDWVIAVGNPFGLGGTVTAGIVSARGRDIGSGPYDDYIQIDAPVNKGNSGGPTFDVDGGVIGVNTAIFSPSGGSVGIAFAIPADTVRTVVAQLKDKGSVLRGWIGVSVQAITPELAQQLNLKRTDGALVTEPQANGPASKAGIAAGDVILSVNGAAVKDSRELAKRIGNMSPGTAVKLVVLSKGAEKNMSLTLGELPAVQEARAEPNEPNIRPPRRDRDEMQRGPERDERPNQRGERRRDWQDREDRGDLRGDRRDREEQGESRGERRRDFGERVEPRGENRRDFGNRERGESGERFAQRERGGEMPRLGLSLSPTENAEGVVIASVEPDSRAAQLGFQQGDVIIEIGGQAVTSPQDVRRALREARNDGKSTVVIRVKSQQGTRTITLPLGRA
jgi:serine protease Do